MKHKPEINYTIWKSMTIPLAIPLLENIEKCLCTFVYPEERLAWEPGGPMKNFKMLLHFQHSTMRTVMA